MTNFKPMKPPTGTLDIAKVQYPVFGSIKYDGFRVAIRQRKTVLNSLNELENRHTREMLENCPELNDHDGELVMLPLNDNLCFNRCQSAFRARAGTPDFRFVVFDRVTPQNFEDRWVKFDKPIYPDWVIVDTPSLILNREQLDGYVNKVLRADHEGVILRRPGSFYKFGRATMKDQQVLRIKPMETSEAVVTDFICEYENQNKAEKDNLGYTKRSSSKEGKVAKDTLGKLVCLHKVWGEMFVSGFSDDLADEIWRNKEKYRGELATFAYQAVGSVGAPRLAKFKGFRARSDMSPVTM